METNVIRSERGTHKYLSSNSILQIMGNDLRNVVLNLSHHAIRVVCAWEGRKIVYWSLCYGVIIQFGGFKGKCTSKTNFVYDYILNWKIDIRVINRYLIS